MNVYMKVWVISQPQRSAKLMEIDLKNRYVTLVNNENFRKSKLFRQSGMQSSLL